MAHRDVARGVLDVLVVGLEVLGELGVDGAVVGNGFQVNFLLVLDDEDRRLGRVPGDLLVNHGVDVDFPGSISHIEVPVRSLRETKKNM